jgi:hypothetical protein
VPGSGVTSDQDGAWMRRRQLQALQGSAAGCRHGGNQPRRAHRHHDRPAVGRLSCLSGQQDRSPRRAGAKGATPLKIALDTCNIHHYLVGAQGALPVDAAGNPWSGSYVYNSGNLVLDLLYNLMLEATGRLQKCRIYESRSFWTRACIASSTASVPMIKARPTSCSAEPHPQMPAPS